jgi:hypothetical protein
MRLSSISGARLMSPMRFLRILEGGIVSVMPIAALSLSRGEAATCGSWMKCSYWSYISNDIYNALYQKLNKNTTNNHKW